MATNKELLEQLGIKLPRTGNKTTCPKCSADRKKKSEPCLQVDIINGIYRCWNPGCEFKGKVGRQEFYKEVKKDFVRPVFVNNTELSNTLVQWFASSRAITQKTLNELRVGEGEHYFVRRSKKYNAVWFNFFRNGEYINTKFRNGLKDFELVGGAEKVFYNLDAIKNSKVAIITEGEIDALSFHEAGMPFVVSVPNGATEGNNNLDYVDNCWEEFEHVEKIIIATDLDGPGQALKNELARRFDYSRCWTIDFGECKDANQVLFEKGAEALREIYDNAQPWPMSGIITLDDCIGDLELIYTKGLQRGAVTTKWPQFDKHVSFTAGHLSMWTGYPNSGKSPFITQIQTMLAVFQGWKFGIFTPEHNPEAYMFAKIGRMIAGTDYEENKLSRDDKNEIDDFMREHFFVIRPDDDFSIENLLSKFKVLVLRKGINAISIDPWNQMDNASEDIARQLKTIIKFAQDNSVHAFAVAHPTKIYSSLKDSTKSPVPHMKNIADSAHFFNMPEMGGCIYQDEENESTEVHIQKMKYDHMGRKGKIFFNVDLIHGSRAFECDDRWRDYGNWLRPQPVQPTLTPLPSSSKFNLDKDDDDVPF